MDHFLHYLFADLGRVFKALIQIFIAFFDFIKYLFDFKGRYEIIKATTSEFTVFEWIMLVITEILIVALAVFLLFLLFKLLKKIFRFRVSVKKYDELAKQVKILQRDLLRANYEKDRLLQMKANELGVQPSELEDEEEKEGEGDEEKENFVPLQNRNTMESPCVDPEESRFFRLTCVDNFYKTQYTPPVYDDTLTLSDICDRFRRFTCYYLKLYYDYTYYTWLRYRVDAPGGTIQAGLNMTAAVSRYAKFSFRYQYKLKQKNNTESVLVNDIYPFHASKLRLLWECNPIDFLTLKTEWIFLTMTLQTFFTVLLTKALLCRGTGSVQFRSPLLPL